jgi:hypothetical protein
MSCELAQHHPHISLKGSVPAVSGRVPPKGGHGKRGRRERRGEIAKKSIMGLRTAGTAFFATTQDFPASPPCQRHEVRAYGRFGLRSDPPGRAPIGAMALCVNRRECGLADATEPMKSGDCNAALVAPERRLDRRKRVVAPNEMRRCADRDVGDRKYTARERDGLRCSPRRHEVAKARAHGIFRDAE